MMTDAPTSPTASRWSIAIFGATILLGAFLLFQVQPLVSKAILPWFGGCPAVWTTCLLFFQTLLFGGYLYAHLLQRWLSPRNQSLGHLLLALAAVAVLPVIPGADSRPPDSSTPTWRILLLLTGAVGLPYFTLSATSPLTQAWFSRRFPGRSPYRLYSLSNFGSLAALLTYPFVFEPALDLSRQSAVWSVAFLVYTILCAALVVVLWRTGDCAATIDAANDVADYCAKAGWPQRFYWLALPAGASMMLLAATNHICQDVATVPFLWVMPLSLYLLSFIICFDHQRWYVRWFWAAAVVPIMAVLVVNEYTRQEHPPGISAELALNLCSLFFACMVCHGELARLKPSPRHLTEFYLVIAAGGALGGLFVAIIAPLVFSNYLEWQIGVAAAIVFAVGLLLPRRIGRRAMTCYVVLAPLVALLMSYLFYWGFDAVPPLDQSRNFFGVVSVEEYGPSEAEPAKRLLVHGRITHGSQATDPAKRNWPTSYYGEDSGVGRSVEHLHRSGPIRVGAIGLGVGTVAAYAQPGDQFHFYEVNPEVLRMAQKHFSYLADCRGTWNVTLGDGRLSLETQPPQKFDLLIVDAFSGDAIPTHLLTCEAFEIYQKHLAPGGLIAVHVSNTYLRLAPVIRRVAEHYGMKTVKIAGKENKDRLTSDNDWMIVTLNDDFVEAHRAQEPASDDDLVAPLWTDQYSNLFRILTGRMGGLLR